MQPQHNTATPPQPTKVPPVFGAQSASEEPHSATAVIEDFRSALSQLISDAHSQGAPLNVSENGRPTNYSFEIVDYVDDLEVARIWYLGTDGARYCNELFFSEVLMFDYGLRSIAITERDGYTFDIFFV